jgi:hypothetical protein
VTFSFADPETGLCGMARPVLWGDGTAAVTALLFADGALVAETNERRPHADTGFERLELPGLQTTVVQPLQTWTVRFDAGEHGFDLTFEAAGPPAELEPDERAARAGELPGYEQLCHVHGTAWLGDRTCEVRCRGQRGHLWGVPDLERVAAWRTLSAWLDDGTGVVLRSVRPAGSAHGDEELWAAVLGGAGSLSVDDPRLSTTYDDAGHQLRAGLELWVSDDDDHPQRATGEVLCGSTVDLGPVKLQCAFLRWRMGGRSGVGRYDVLHT